MRRPNRIGWLPNIHFRHDEFTVSWPLKKEGSFVWRVLLGLLYYDGFICSVVNIITEHNVPVFLSAALVMSFKVFDYNLKLIESIKHEERAVISLEYDSKKKLLLSSGASGITIWKFYHSDVNKFKKHYPNWDYKYNIDDIINEMIKYELKKWKLLLI